LEEEEQRRSRGGMEEERKAHLRIRRHLRHLFPGIEDGGGGGESTALIEGDVDPAGDPRLLLLEASPTVASDPAYDLPPELVSKGWLSQPQEFDYDLEVEGQLPRELRGTLFRNGPGLLEVYGTPLVHPIDGDGMVCSIKFEDGKAHFRSAYVKTTGYVMEQKAKKLLFKGMMGTKPPATWNETEDVMHTKMPGQTFKNTSNTNVYYWGGKLLSTWESGLPYYLDPATLETVGKDDLNGTLKGSRCLAAHFRHDPVSNRLVTFSFQLAMSGQCRLFIYEFDHTWQVKNKQVHSFDHFYYCHDFLLTEHYYIFHNTPFYKLSEANVAKIISGVKSPGQLMHYYPELPSRMIVIPRDGSKGNVSFFDIDPCMIYHHCNAWEEGDKIHFSSVCIGEKFNMDFDQGIWLSNASVEPGLVYNFTIDLAKHTIVRSKADFCSCEFPTVNTLMNGKRWRYAYLMASDSPQKPIPYQEIVKFDRLGLNRQVWSSREEFATLGEPVFAPRNREAEEDDGWVIAQLYDCKHHATQYVVLDAQNLARGPIARVKLAHHTPYGFHGTFTPEVFY